MSVILVINPGSTSKKYALYHERKAVMSYQFEKTASAFELSSTSKTGVQDYKRIDMEGYTSALTTVATAIKKYLEEKSLTLDSVCIRIVSPGSNFQNHQLVDEALVIALRQKEMSVPLHVPVTLQEIQECQKLFPETPFYAISDSAFHSTLMKKARDFSIDRSDAETYDIYRFGYHGLSVASVVRRVHPLTGINPKRLVVCHVGGGVSVTAVKDGRSVETTMGYTPTSGLPMGSRTGDVDPGALLQLMRAKNLKPSEAEMYIHIKGGLQGLSEDTDIRHLLDRRAKGDAIATETLDLFVYHIQKAIAAATVSLGGLDMIVFTGTACTRSATLRKMIASDLDYLGVSVDENKNEALVGLDGVFSAHKAEVKLVAVKTDEMGEMAIEAELMKHKE